ncbi:MAG TPA: DUF4097 family beta strand repeat-containing protein [Nitriliruptoraceae bacterium]|nr:DUF4097 family beta strand repeat-containing protein [Nitriliruptoraceae bacterium]
MATLTTQPTPPPPPPAPDPAGSGPPSGRMGTPGGDPTGRPRSSGRGILIGMVLGVVVLLGLGAAGVVAAMLPGDGATDTGTEAFANIDSIVLDLGGADVELVAGAGDVVVDHEVRTGALGGEAGAVARDGTLELTFDCPGWAQLPFDGVCDGEYTITVPAGVVVTGGTDNGSLRVDGLDSRLSLHTGNGDIHMVGTGGDIEVDTSNGRITGTHLVSPSARATTSNGGVVLDFAVAPRNVEVDTSNGLVHEQVPDDATSYDVDASTSNGSVSTSVTVDESSSRRVELTSSNGNVVVETR